MQETAVFPDPGHDRQARARARRLAAELELPLGDCPKFSPAWRLVAGRDRLTLQAERPGPGFSAGARLSPDWLSLDTVSPAGSRRNQPLLKAVRGKKRGGGSLILDATAGLGFDDWILASLGCRVLAVERSPAVFALLRDALARAGVERPRPAGRIRVAFGESRDVLSAIAGEGSPASVPCSGNSVPLRPDVVYLDPMFPDPQRRKGASKKEISMLRGLVGPPGDSCEEMLRLALLASRRVVVKRPVRDEPLHPGGGGPVHSIRGRGYRYDIYIRP